MFINHIVRPSLDLGGFAALAAELGFDGIELRNDLGHSSPIGHLSADEARTLLEGLNIHPFALNALQRCNEGASREALLEELSHMVDLVGDVGGSAVVLCPVNDTSDSRSPEARLEETRQNVAAYASVLEKRGIVGLIEPLGFPESSLRSQIDAAGIVQELDSPYIKLLIDSFHFAVGPDSLEELDFISAADIGLVHLSGVEVEPPVGDSYRDPERVLLSSKDRIGNVELLRVLGKKGYSGPLSFEPFSPEVHKLSEGALKDALNQSRTILEEALG